MRPWELAEAKYFLDPTEPVVAFTIHHTVAIWLWNVMDIYGSVEARKNIEKL
jgi:hypothetical protein